MSYSRRDRDREEEQRGRSSSSPYRSREAPSQRDASPITSKYRDSEGNEIPVYRTSCPGCHNHVKEMIRIHELWQITKKDLRESRRAHENLLKEYKEEVDKSARQHGRIVDGFHDEIEALRGDLKLKSEQVSSLRAENAALQRTCSELNEQLSHTHEKYAEQVSAHAALQIRVRELEQALTSFRLEREAEADLEGTIQSMAEEVRQSRDQTEKVAQEKEENEREIRRLQHVIQRQEEDMHRQQEEMQRYKKAEREQSELFDSASQERARLTSTIHQQASALEDANVQIGSLRRRTEELQEDVRRMEEENANLRQQLRQQRQADERKEEQTFGEIKRSRKNIEERLAKLQNECAQVAHLMSPGKGTGAGAGAGVHERLPDWMPPDVVRLVKSFRANQAESGHPVGEEMSSFLIALNRIWRERLEEKLRQARLHHAADVRELKRRLAQRIPYEQVVQKARILRLQKDLDTTRAVHLKSRGDASKGLLDLSLSTVENLSRQILEYEKENTLLKSQLSILAQEKSTSHARSSEAADILANQAISAVNQLADQLWNRANSFVDRCQRMATSGDTDVADKLNEECQHFLDSLERDVRECKTTIKRTLAEMETEEGEEEWRAETDG